MNPFSENMNIISELGDRPNTDDGLTARQLKGKFDEAGNKIKNYINTEIYGKVLDKPVFNGMAKMQSGSLVKAEPGTDYQTPLTAGTDYQPPIPSGTYATPANVASAVSDCKGYTDQKYQRYRTVIQNGSTTEYAYKINVTISASDPSGGQNGDIWFKYELPTEGGA